jgi:hypothetical protein
VLRVRQDVLDLGITLPASTSRRLLLLENAAAVPLEFVWDLGVYQPERQAISGRLQVVPASGESSRCDQLVWWGEVTHDIIDLATMYAARVTPHTGG